MAADAYRPDHFSHGAVRPADAVLLRLLHGFRRALAWPRGYPPDMAGQDPRRRVRAGAAKRLLHRMGHLLFRMGAGSFLCSADTGHAAVSVRLCRPVQGRFRHPRFPDRPGAAAAVAHPARRDPVAVAHRYRHPAGVENGAGGAGSGAAGDRTVSDELLRRVFSGAEARGAAGGAGHRPEPADAGEKRQAAVRGRPVHAGGHQAAVRRLPAVRTGHEPAAKRHGERRAGADARRADENGADHQRVP